MSATETVSEPAVQVVSEAVESPDTAEAPVLENRIYIGNLPDKTKGEQIKDFLEGFTTQDIRIPKSFRSNRRGTRRNNVYAFVTLASKEEAEKAVETLNEKTLGENAVTVKIANPKTVTEEKPKAKKSPRKNKKTAATSASSDEASKESPEAKDGESKDGESETKASAPKKKKTRKVIKREPIPGTISHEDTVFVSNLPFGATKENLIETFQDLEPEWGYVAVSSSSRSKGSFRHIYGFVKFKDGETQQKALQEYGDKSIGNRKLRLSAAKERAPTSDSEKSEEKSAPSTAASETTTVTSADAESEEKA